MRAGLGFGPFHLHVPRVIMERLSKCVSARGEQNAQNGPAMPACHRATGLGSRLGMGLD